MPYRCVVKKTTVSALGMMLLFAGCGPTPAEQRAFDQDRCAGFGFVPNTDACDRCMMGVASQRDAEAAADRRAAAARDVAEKRARDAAQAARDQAERDAWDQRTGQGKYSSAPDFGPSSNPVDAIRDQIEREQNEAEGSD